MRFFIGFLVTIGLIILIIVLLLRGGGTATPAPKALNLGNYATGTTTAELILDSPIVDDADHREIKIDVTQNDINFTEYQGYQQNVINSQTFPNNQTAYAVFLHALQNEGFTLGSTDQSLHDERGVCPSGNRYIYSFTDGSKQLMRFWSTSCSGAGTFKGRPSSIRGLFEKQVPNYDNVARDFNLNVGVF